VTANARILSGLRTHPLHALPLVLLAATVSAQLLWPLQWDRFTMSHVVVALGACTMLLHCYQHFRLRGVVATVCVAGLAWVIETVGVATTMPFGAYHYSATVTYLRCPVTQTCTDSSRVTHALTTIAGIPIIVILAWFMTAYAAHMTARRISQAPRGIWMWSTLMLAGWDLYLDPQFILDPHLAHGWWIWADSQPHLPGVPGIPVTNFLGWFIAAGLIQLLLIRVLPEADTVVSPRNGYARVRSLTWNVPTWFMVWTWVGGAIAVGWFLHQVAAAAWGAVVLAPAMIALMRAHR
jgi:putative membrane protein